MKNIIGAILLALVCSSCISANADNVSFTLITTKVGEKSWQLELAESSTQRRQGLQNRTELCTDCGMIFKFAKPMDTSFWMKNTSIPLDLAYISEQGEILSIMPLEPFELEPVYSNGKVLYAWEMNRGWFAKNKVQVGAKVTFH